LRRLIAALACRAEGSRLYGKPLQNLDVASGTTILDHIISVIRTLDCIQGIVLGVSEGSANVPFIELARRRGVDFVVGDPQDVLRRLIQCGQRARGSDVFRVTTESPFLYYELLHEAWERHVWAGNDVTTVDGLPEGSHFEIYTLAALERSHVLGDARHRSELCSLYIREHRDDFKVEVLPIPPEVARLDLRLTVDYPEDLVLCRRIYEHLKSKVPRLPVAEIVDFVDHHPELQALVAPYVVPERLW